MKRLIWGVLIIGVVVISFYVIGLKNNWQDKSDSKAIQQEFIYRDRMRQLVIDVSKYGKQKKKDFLILGNNSLELYHIGAYEKKELVFDCLKAVDGIAMEEFYYGWNMNDNIKTDEEIQKNCVACLKLPIEKGVPIFNIDYCNKKNTIEDSLKKNMEQGFISFAAVHRELDIIPKYPSPLFQENNENIDDLSMAKNFLILLNAQKYSNKKTYLKKISETNYDVLIIDSHFDDELLTKKDLALLKYKKNGSIRQVIAYMSLGEAEDYRDYWQESWKNNPPEWLEKANENWEGNYKVKYWHPEWRRILFGQNTSNLDLIINADFDGVFLDVLDAWAYFEERQ